MRKYIKTGKINKTTAWLLTAVALCLFLSVPAFAESSSTTATVTFTSEDTAEPVPPVDPDKPRGQTSGGNSWANPPAGQVDSPQQIPGATGAAGWLSINYVTPLNFNQEIEDDLFTVQHERPYLQTSDLRGTATGWKVTAIAGPFHNPADMSTTPALLSFSDGSANSAYTYLEPPEIPDLIQLPANGSTQRLIEFADEDEGVGIWVARWYPTHGAEQDFQLRLFAEVSDGRLGVVLWVMNDAP